MDATFYAFALSFATEHPFLTWCALWLLWPIITLPFLIVALISQSYRAIMVSLRGWPPAHLDADGDWKPEPKTETKTETDAVVVNGDMIIRGHESPTIGTHTHTGLRPTPRDDGFPRGFDPGRQGINPTKGPDGVVRRGVRRPIPGDPDYIPSIDG